MEMRIAICYFIVAFSIHLMFLRLSYGYWVRHGRSISIKARNKHCFWSNCIIEAATAKILDWNSTKLRIFVPFLSKGRFFHVAWEKTVEGTTYLYDFQPEFAELRWYEFPLYSGFVRCRKVNVSELCT